ncbi:MAG: hydrogenase expression/formation protein HypE [Planctomycetota bacterium]
MVPLPEGGPLIADPERILLAHGGGGQLTDELVRELIRPRLGNVWLDELDDAAVLPEDAASLVFTTDSYVVQPLEFPGGDIGTLAVSGTVNDLAVCGAVPKHLSLGLILEEGLEVDVLARIVDSIARTAEEADVRVVTGDTKVVGRGQADGMYVSTSGVGVFRGGVDLGVDRVRPGDAVLLSGTIADHGLAVMLAREKDWAVKSELRSDAAPLAGLIGRLLDRAPETAFLRDPTRGGLAAVLSDLADRTGRTVTVEETRIPIRPETAYAADMLGLDALTVANEGKVVVVVPQEGAERALAALRDHPHGRDAAVIGRVEEEGGGICELVTEVGGRRVVRKPYGEELPRIC